MRQFNTLFKKRYRLSPTGLRRQTSGGRKQEDNITINLGYRPPYPWEQMLNFLAVRAISGVESVKDGKYFRTVHLVTAEQKHIYGWISVADCSEKNMLSATISTSLLPLLPQVLARIRHLFDLCCDPDAIYEVLSDMNTIRPNICVLGTRLPGCFNSFELTVRAVLGQQITVKAARTLAARFVKAFGTPVQTEIDGLTHTFPQPADIIDLNGEISSHLGPLGIISARAKTILELAHTFISGDIKFDLCAQPEAEIKKLMNISGIGNWTAQYIAMRTMGWPDAFLETDAGIKKALPTFSSKEMLTTAEAWRPWRSYATINLWNSLN